MAAEPLGPLGGLLDELAADIAERVATRLPVAPQPEQNALTPHEAADFLQVSLETVYRECRAGRLPHLRVGRAIRLSRQGLIAAMQEQEAMRSLFKTAGAAMPGELSD